MNQPPHSQHPATLATPPQQQAPAVGQQNGAQYYGPHVPWPPVDVRATSLWSRVPVVYWVGLGIGALAFVVHMSFQETMSGPDSYSCSYSDFAGFLAAAAIVVLTIVGWATRAARQVADRLPVPLMAALTVLLLALAFVHALRGNGTIMSPCDAHPAP